MGIGLMLTLLGCPNPNPSADVVPVEEKQSDHPNQILDADPSAVIVEAKKSKSATLHDSCTFVPHVTSSYDNAYGTVVNNNNKNWALCDTKLLRFKDAVIDGLSESHAVSCQQTTNVSVEGNVITLIETCEATEKETDKK